MFDGGSKEDPTLGGRVLPPDRVLPEFEEDAQEVEILAHLHLAAS
jgi:hypothetical protein